MACILTALSTMMIEELVFRLVAGLDVLFVFVAGMRFLPLLPLLLLLPILVSNPFLFFIFFP